VQRIVSVAFGILLLAGCASATRLTPGVSAPASALPAIQDRVKATVVIALPPIHPHGAPMRTFAGTGNASYGLPILLPRYSS
jgi:hypothetical protein